MRRALLVALAVAVAPAGAACDGAIGDAPFRATGPGGAATCQPCVGESPLLRLTRVEYERTLRDVFGDAFADALRFDHLPSDGAAGPFASNAGSGVDEDGVEGYRAVAESAGTQAAASAATLLGCDAGAVTDACIDAFVRRIGTRLYRGRFGATELGAYKTLFASASARGGAADGVRLVVTAMLQSPYFLYRPEPGRATRDPMVRELSGEEMATRLAFFLWKEGPDDRLLAAAASGELSTADGVRTEARRMLADERADFAIVRFHTEWLGVASLPTRSIDETRYPELGALRDDMLDETERLTKFVMREGDGRLESMLVSPISFVSADLASFYGVTGTEQDGALRVALDASERTGVLTHAAFLVAHTNDPTTAAVHRGKAIREGMLCQDLPAPPPIDRLIAPDPSLSSRQQLEQKTSPERCIGCHLLMNPLGFAFEHYDATGSYRTMDGTHPIDATGDVAESDIAATFDGALELSELLAQSAQVHRCVTRQWMRFALGRVEQVGDEPSLDEVYDRYEASGRDLRELIVAITGTPAFRYRRVPAAP